MKLRALLIVLGLCSFVSLKAADAEAAWQELSRAAKPPAPPAEWNQKRPTAEQMKEWQSSLIPLCEGVAAKAKKFYEENPDHPKAGEARLLEKRFLAQAAGFKRATDAPKRDEGFQKAYAEAVEKIKARRADGPMGVADELEKQGRDLAARFPAEAEPWNLLLSAASYAGPARSAELYKDIQANAPSDELKRRAEQQLKKLGAVGRPFELSFTALDGKKIDIADYKGKVVLVDFWAVWCGPCVAELPNVKAAYKELHPQGFEILGISLDDDEAKLKRFLEKNEMPWPQFFDGQGWKNKIAVANGINSIPAMYLVDKKGVLRDMSARQDLEKKVRDLLAE